MWFEAQAGDAVDPTFRPFDFDVFEVLAVGGFDLTVTRDTRVGERAARFAGFAFLAGLALRSGFAAGKTPGLPPTAATVSGGSRKSCP